MTPIQKERMDIAATALQPLRAALNALPDQQSQDPLVRQCLDAGRSLCSWIEALAAEMPTPDGTPPALSAPIAKDTLRHVSAIGNYAAAASFKLMTKATDEGLKKSYKWVNTLAEYIQKQVVALADNYTPAT